MPSSQDFAKFIDDLRDSRNIKREDFVKDILSLRQYYRFIAGESSIKNETINQLLERLEVNSVDAYAKFLFSSNKSKKILYKAYNHMRDMNYNKASQVLDSIDYDSLIQVEEKKFYKFILYYIEYHTNQSTQSDSINEIAKIINYPTILKKSVLNSYELSALSFLSTHLIKINRDFRIANFLYDTLMNQNNSFIKEMPSSLLASYAGVSNNLGQIGEYQKSVDLADLGIKKSKEMGNMSSILNLLYVKALGHRCLSQDLECKETLVRIFSHLRMLNNVTKTSLFKKTIFKHFEVNEEDLIVYLPIKK